MIQTLKSGCWKLLLNIFPFLSQFNLEDISAPETSHHTKEKLPQLNIDPALLSQLEDSLLESAPFGLCVVKEHYVTVWNLALTKISGLPSESLIGKKTSQIPNLWRCLIEETLKSAQKDIYRYPLHTVSFSRWFNCHKTSLYDAKGIFYTLILIEDVTEIEQLQKQANTNERMMSLGRVAGNMAEEISRPMSAIAFTVQNLMRTNDLAPEEIKAYQEIFNQTLRVKHSLERLSSYAHPRQQHQFDRISLKEHINNAIKVAHIAASNIKNNIPKEFCLPFDDAIFQQIFVTLFENAFDAIASDGLITIDCEEHSQFTVIIIRDNGCGIPREHLSRIFEPFFSTKKGPGNGSGMGLAIVYRLVKDMGGDIYIDSAMNVGTEVFVRLPKTPMIRSQGLSKSSAKKEVLSCSAS